MKLKPFQKIIPDQDVQRALWGQSYDADVAAVQHGENREKGQPELVSNLFKSDYNVVCRAISFFVHPEARKGSCEKLLAKIGKYADKKGEACGLNREQVKEIIGLCSSGRDDIASVRKRSIPVPNLGEEPARKMLTTKPCEPALPPLPFQGSIPQAPCAGVPLQFDQFPAEWCACETLGIRAAQLKNNLQEGEAIIEEIKRRVKMDPAIASLSRNDAAASEIASKHNAPYDAYRAGREIPGTFFNGSDVQTDLQNFLLFGCPRGAKDTSDFFDTVLRRGIRVIVSLNANGESRRRYFNFWENERLKTLTLRDGWSIEKVAERILAAEPTGFPKVVESTLLASKGDEKIELHHFHYDGWKDKQPMPSEGLLDILYRRIEEINPSPDPAIAINCRGGVGRTGTGAVGYYARRYVDRVLSTGTKQTVNIPEIIYQFRKRRSGIIGQPSQLAQVYSLTYQYYQQKVSKAVQPALRTPPSEDWALSQLRSIADTFRANEFQKSTDFLQQIADSVAHDPVILSQTPKESSSSERPNIPKGFDATYDKNRVARDIPGLCLNWSDIHTPYQRYFAGGCPHTLEGVSAVFGSLLASGGEVIVSLHQPGEETQDRINTFWTKEIVSQLQIPGGWTIENIGERCLFELPLQPGGTRIPRLMETTLEASRGAEKKVLTHLHYDGWVDKQPMPSFELFGMLMQKVMILSPTLIATNCRGGIGRTGVFLVSHFLLTHIIDQLKRGISVDAVQVNLANAIRMFRAERKNILIGKREPVQVIEYLARIYEQIKVLGVPAFLAQYRR